MSPILEMRDVRMHFPVPSGLFGTLMVKAVDGVSLEIRKGETLALIGESGSGKTTLGRLSLGTIKPTSGQVIFDGRDTAGLRGRDLLAFRRRAQAIFQDPYSSLDPFMTVLQIVEEPLAVHGVGRRGDREEAVHRVLREVRLNPEEVASKYPHMLSGGQRQRVNIARALVLDPEYIAADEPVSMIDVSSRTEILGILRELQRRRGLALLYITHDIANAVNFAERIAVMYLGRIVEQGAASRVVAEPLHPYTIALIQAVPELDPSNRLRDRTSVSGEPPSAGRVPSGCRFHPRCKYFIPGRCDVIDPPLVEVRDSRQVACHLYPSPDGAKE